MWGDKTFKWSLILPFIFLVSAGVSFGAAPQEPVNGCPSWGTPIYVHIHGIRNARGAVKAVLYGPDPKTFLVKGKKVDKEREPAEAGSMTLCVAAHGKRTLCGGGVP